MAMIKIEGAEVVRLIPGYGFKAKKAIELRNGETKDEYYTVWTNAPAVEGAEVDIVGTLGTKLEEFTGRDGVQRQVVAIHVNDAKVTASAGAPF